MSFTQDQMCEMELPHYDSFGLKRVVLAFNVLWQ